MSARLPIVLALAVLAAGPAAAGEDAGTRSVFATGAGNRALALGSAFNAVADDASALLWNPAGLGDVARSEFQISQADLDALGFRETFAGFVLPDWRWGAAAVTLRHYGVGGIDGRDARNQPTGTFGDEETELALGYGRAIGEAWSVGASARVRRQSLAGHSGSGLGADLGMKVRPGVALGSEGWMRDLQLGLAIQNAVEPAIRLDRESVADPLTVRAGVAWARPWALGGALFLLDVEKPRGLGARGHAGLELTPHPWFVLRGGLDQGVLTAGAGLKLGFAVFDYAFADHPAGASHRAGLTWRIGRSVGEARLAAERAEEDRLQERLAALERERQAERLATLLAGAHAAHDAGRHDEALEALTTLLAIDSTHAGARALRDLTLHDRARALETRGDWAGAAMAWARLAAERPGDSAAAAGLARSRAESDRRAVRSAELRRAFAAALDAFAADDLAAAHDGFAALAARDPNDTESAAMLRRVEAAIGRRTGAWLQQAGALIDAGSLDEARRLIDRTRTLDPHARGLGAAAGALARADGAQNAERARARETARPAAPAPARLTREQERTIATLYRQGLDALERGRSDDGLRALEQVRAMRAGYGRVDELLKREYLTRGMEMFSAGRLDAAVGMWERALQVDPHDARTVGYLARAHEQMARAREISGEDP